MARSLAHSLATMVAGIVVYISIGWLVAERTDSMLVDACQARLTPAGRAVVAGMWPGVMMLNLEPTRGC